MESVTTLSPALVTGKKPHVAAPPTKPVGFDPGKAGIVSVAMSALPVAIGMPQVGKFTAPPEIATTLLSPAAKGYAAAKSAFVDPDG